MDEVAATVGISHGLAYRYFANKDALVRALAEELLRRPDAPDVLAMLGTPWQRLEQLVSRVVNQRREHPESFRLLHHVLSERATPDDLQELARARAWEFRVTLRQLIVDGQASGEIAGDHPDQLVTAVTACLDGLTAFALNQPEASRASFPDAAIVLRMLRVPGGGDRE
jgi:AcrR family transcriptional regulator